MEKAENVTVQPQGGNTTGARSTALDWQHRVRHTGLLFGEHIWTKTLCPSEEVGTQKPHIEVGGRITRLCTDIWRFTQEAYTNMEPDYKECCSGQLHRWNLELGSAVPTPHVLLQEHHCSTDLCTGSWYSKKSISPPSNVHQLREEYPKEPKSSSS